MNTNVFVSFLYSFIYWIYSNDKYFRRWLPQFITYIIDTYQLSRCVFKLLAILSLTIYSEISIFVLLFYCAGDFVMTFKETEAALFFFDLGHSVLLLLFILFGTLFELLIFIPLMCVSVYFTSAYFPKSLPYKIHNVILHFLLYYALTSGNYIVICFIASDILIGLKRLKILTWPLYYFTVLQLATTSSCESTNTPSGCE